MKNSNVQKVLANYRNFGFCFGTSFLFTKTLFRKKEHKTRLKAIKILEKKFRPILLKYQDKEVPLSGVDDSQKNIFIFWWTGFETAPKMVKDNVLQIKKYYPDYHLYLLTRDNYASYVSLSNNILSLFEKGKNIYSNFFRYSSLSAFRPIWWFFGLTLPCGFFKREPLFERLKTTGFYSLNCQSKERDETWGQVNPEMNYLVFYMGSVKGNPVMTIEDELYEAYYQKYDFCIDYFMNGYFMTLTQQYHIGKDCLTNVPLQEGNPFYLMNCLITHQVPKVEECLKCPQKLNWRNPEANDFKIE
jgi:hypothetical protein